MLELGAVSCHVPETNAPVSPIHLNSHNTQVARLFIQQEIAVIACILCDFDGKRINSSLSVHFS